MEWPKLETARLRLWMPEPGAAAELLRYQKDNREHLIRWMPVVPRDLYTLPYWQKRLARQLREYEEGSAAHFAISWRDRDPDRVIGTANLFEIARGPLQSCLLGYGLDQREQGQGAMTEALGAVIEFAFETLKLHRIRASYNPINGRSAAVLKRLGFTVEGYARDYLFTHGVWEDHVQAALINPRPVSPPQL